MATVKRQISFDRGGEGAPLLLVHGSGGHRRVWKPVIEQLRSRRDVIAIDLPGHGQSPLPPTDIPPTPLGYARMLLRLLDSLDLESVHVAGNSVGGWVALELAKLGGARSVVALSPAGLWRREAPREVAFKLWLNRRLGRATLPVARGLVKSATGRRALLAGSLGKPAAIPGEEAIDLLEAFATAPGFDEHLRATRRDYFSAGQTINVPVTVAFGERDRLLTARNARSRASLPAHARWLSLPGCGHIPTWDAPELIAQTILDGTSTVTPPHSV